MEKVLALFVGFFLVGATSLDPGRFPIDVEDVADGTANDMLGWSTGGVAESISLEGAHAYHDANQSINNNAFTVLSLNQERHDDNAMHDLVTNNSRITIQTTGRYLVNFTGWFDTNSTGERIARVLINGSTELSRNSSPALSINGTAMSLSTIRNLSATDYLEVFVWQNSGGALNFLSTADWSPQFSVQRLRN